MSLSRARPRLVARQRDRLGSRLHAILNAWGVAKVLDMEFRFVWPRNECTELRNPEEIFDEDFLQVFELPESAFSSESIDPNLRWMTLEQAQKFCHEHEDGSFLLDVNFEIFAFAAEHPEAARKRFLAGLTEIDWSPEIRELLTSEASHAFEAIHLRAGDIIHGAWRHTWPVGKYLPSAFADYIIRELEPKSHAPLVIFSDNAEYAAFLQRKFKTVKVSAEMVPRYASLTESQQAFADVIMLSKASYLYAPSRSNFSQFAAHIGEVTILSVAECLSAEDARSIALTYLQDAVSHEQPQVLHRLLARDICWLLDVFSDSLTLDERIKWAEHAISFDPEFCIAKNKLAMALAQRGRFEAAKDEVSKAIKISERLSIHQDAQFESLACLISIETLKLIASGSGEFSTFKRQCQSIRKALDACDALRPAMISRREILANLRFIVSSIEWATQVDRHVCDVFRDSLVEASPPDFSVWRTQGFAILRNASGPFPGLLRNIEEISIIISLAIGATLSNLPLKLQRTVACGIEQSHILPSGLQWTSGWVYHVQQCNALVIGLVSKGRAMHGAVATINRPDIAKKTNDSFAINSGFLIPMPQVGLADGVNIKFVIVTQQPSNLWQRLRNLGIMVRDRGYKLEIFLLRRIKSS